MQERLFNHTGFNAFLAEHQLMASRCAACGQLYLPPRPLCAQCHAALMEWFPLSGQGKLAAVTTIYVGLPGMAAEGYSRARPYHTGVVQLVEGPSISAQILLPEGAQPGSGQIGMPLRAVFLERSSGAERRVVLAFEKLAEAAASAGNST